ncbi:hypothetical protein U9M48_016079, partial [Paspalum notatum var. saurae]
GHPTETSRSGGCSWSTISFELATRVARQLIDLIAQEKQRRDPQEISYTDFAALQPPIFTTAPHPLDADDRLRIIESKFVLPPHLGEQRRLALRRNVRMVPRGPAGHQVTWDEFRAAFRAHYLPPSLIELKQREFRALRQGDMSVLEYVQAFIRLSQYSPEDVNTDPRRATRLLDGFDPTLLTHLGRSYDSFNELVDVAIDMEHRLRQAHEDQQKKRLASTPPSSPSQRPRVEYQFPTHIYYLEEPPQQEQYSGAEQPMSFYSAPPSPPAPMPPTKSSTGYTCFK